MSIWLWLFSSCLEGVVIESGACYLLKFAVLCCALQALCVDEPTSPAAEAPPDVVTAPLLTRHSSASSLTDLVVIPSSPVGGLLPLAFSPGALQPFRCCPSCPAWLDLLLRMLLPVLVLCVGLGFSIAALSVAVGNMRRG